MNFVAYPELVRDSVALARKLPRDTRAVVGIARSGMLPASIIAQELGCHLGDARTYAETGALYRPGRRLTMSADSDGPVVVVDDSVHSGHAMREARELLGERPHLTASVYVSPGKDDEVDVFARILETPRLFAWNWTGSALLSRVLCDFDGILCTDSDVFDDDGPEYVQALQDARPLHTVRRRIRAIVTARLDRWRGITEAWLEEHSVDYGRLVMAPFGTASERRSHGNGRWKASVYGEDEDALLFIESSQPQAKEIAKRTARPVLCPPIGRMFR